MRPSGCAGRCSWCKAPGRARRPVGPVAPFIYRRVGDNPFLRELIIPFRASGYVVLYEIDGESIVNIVAVRHQLEDDYY